MRQQKDHSKEHIPSFSQYQRHALQYMFLFNDKW